ncbi:hypothetical protein A3D11_01080 [Candidatus Peribacteria bacterium RIFCSPHIGHO2_02_FULL_49_16]|uniref:Uncharacterized protein n=1 Tax=Candidatus Kaiserbacteria bacterium RIFCSPHIGHO2_01_FULL_53_29 TaxID=1798480 RepID=A0A1F6CXZ8_9BACT|nr:MAG: hypothetical protein A2851_05840 [Candidatus Kaiserbacteria bacterium RIFCSPHIGHO2_01_FULL_53_29]OGJ59293.1 MAG: hypothetical protein A3D11_01080 [Candidatus Peribacteria bacterium RIFCSPHIGHO2_02_FULL_49_16]
MQNKYQHHFGTASARRFVAIFGVALLLMPQNTFSASSWSPTLLVNTESFQIIDEGDATTDIEIRFGDTVNEKIYWDRTNAEFRFSDDIRVDGNITASGTVTVSGNVKTKANLTINSDSGNADAVFTFGSDTTDETLTFINAEDTLEWSDDFQVTGNLAASGKLVIDGGAELNSTVKINGVTYTFPFSDGTATGKVLKTDGAGNLSWSTDINDGADKINDYYVRTGGDTMTGALTIKRVSGTLDQNLLTISGGRIRVQTTAPNDDIALITISGGSLDVSGNANISGTTLSVGSITTRGDLTLNIDQTAANTVLTFGSDTTNETLTFINAEDTLEWSDDFQVTGNLAASGKLVIDGATELNSTVKINGVTYTFPFSDGTATGKVLKTDGAGNLVWSDDTAGRSSGSIISFHPEYPNAAYFASGSTAVGTLGVRYAESGSGLGNFYRWQTTKLTNQDYWVSTRIRIPDNFSTWQATKPIELRYRTHSGTVNVYAKGTDDANVALTDGSDLDTNDWTTATITGPEAGGTWTAGGYATFLIQLINSGATFTNRTWADISWLNLNIETSD